MNQQFKEEDKKYLENIDSKPNIEKIKEFTQDKILVFFMENILEIAAIFIIFFWKTQIKNRASSLETRIDNIENNKKDIDISLVKICQIANADRVILGRFHNGAVFEDGEHELSFSATNEYREKGFSSVLKTIQNIPALKLKEEIKKLQTSNYLFISLKNAEKKCKNYMLSNNLKQVIEMAINKNSKNKQIIGIVSIQFQTINKKNNIANLERNKEKLQKIEDERIIIEIILNKRINRKKIFGLF